jgi:hypothetical protein
MRSGLGRVLYGQHRLLVPPSESLSATAVSATLLDGTTKQRRLALSPSIHESRTRVT